MSHGKEVVADCTCGWDHWDNRRPVDMTQAALLRAMEDFRRWNSRQGSSPGRSGVCHNPPVNCTRYDALYEEKQLREAAVVVDRIARGAIVVAY